MTTHPVLIGSNALQYYGYTEPVNDIDVIVTIENAKDLCFISGKREGKMLFFTNNERIIKMDLVYCDTEANKYIYDICNKNYKTITIIDNIRVILPPLEILYMIKKSHIHRILNLTDNNLLNLEIWEKHMKMYLWMRNKLDYNKMNTILYGESKYGEVLSISNEDDKSDDYIYRKVFTMKFNETNERVGDTYINFDQTEKDFFDDNVKRYIHHDELHKKIALLCRNTEDTLYDKYKIDKTNANIEKDLFMNADNDEKIQCLREEIMVLYIERKLLPEVMECYVSLKIPIPKYNIKSKEHDIREIIAHFMTNLCGKGHNWLRQYALDNYDKLSDISLYRFDDLLKVVVKIANPEKVNEPNELQTIDRFMKDALKYGFNNFTECICDEDYYCMSHTLVDDVLANITESKAEKHNNLNITCEKFDKNMWNIQYWDKSHKNVYDELPGNVKKYVDTIALGDHVISSISGSPCCLYNFDINLGIIASPKKSELFYCKIDKTKKKNYRGENTSTYNFSTGVIVIDSNKQNYDMYEASYFKKYHTYYYHSSDSDSYDTYDYRSKTVYLSSFGDSPHETINILYELFAKKFLYVKDTYYEKWDKKNYDMSSSGSGDGYSHRYPLF